MPDNGFLEKIDSPDDLKRLSVEELPVLADEIRKLIIEVVSARGGHLASSLGAVEIAIALHYVFDSPVDRILWDVGHQSYAHKILTGRREEFKTLRTRHGISGFPNIFENRHDSFGVGHACTAISAATGFAVARDLDGADNFIVSVVGDGSISGGLSLEGINHAGNLKKNRFVIILNDNEMSISKNVGALSRYLTKITTKRPYLQFEADVWELLGRIPSMGGKARKLAKRIKESIKTLVVPTILFEELGFRYIGPLDGHDVELLVDTFSKLHQLPGPVLVHVLTTKGKGYQFAEADAVKYHGVGSFYKKTGNSKSNSRTEKYSDVFGRLISLMAERDERIVAITAAMKDGTGLACFAEKFPKRFFDVGISEQHAVTFAAGLAREGFKPFVAIYSTFLQRSLDQIIHDVALQNLPVRFIIDRAGIVGEDGPTHHGTFDLSYLSLVPGMIVMAPADENEMSRMMVTMGGYGGGPAAMRFPRGSVAGVPATDADEPLKMGEGRIVKKGMDAALISIGSMLAPAMEASGILGGNGLDVAVADARFLKPLDGGLIRELSSNGRRIFTLEENSLRGGFGDAVMGCLSAMDIQANVTKLGIADGFVPHGTREELLEEQGLTAEAIARTILDRIHSGSKAGHGGVA